jgi:hypothetical protein
MFCPVTKLDTILQIVCGVLIAAAVIVSVLPCA